MYGMCVCVCSGKRKKNAKTHWETNKSVKQQDKYIYYTIYTHIYTIKKNQKKKEENAKKQRKKKTTRQKTKQKIIKTI